MLGLGGPIVPPHPAEEPPPAGPGRNHVSDTIYLDFSAEQTDTLVFSEFHKRLTLGNGDSYGCAGSEPMPGRRDPGLTCLQVTWAPPCLSLSLGLASESSWHS